MSLAQVAFVPFADCDSANSLLLGVVLLGSWVFVLITHILAQETNGLTKSAFGARVAELLAASSDTRLHAVFLFWIQTLLVMLSSAHKAFGW
jgi:hypothetical protein